MDDKDFSEVLNNTQDLTLGQIFKLIFKIRFKVLMMFIATFVAITGSAYMAGQASIKQETAVMLHTPFSMRINLGDNQYDFDNLTLIEDPMVPSPTNETIMLSLRQIKSSFDIIPIGQVVAVIDRDHVPSIWKWLFSSVSIKNAYAQPEMVFDWNGHHEDYRFKEKHIDDHIIHRYYTDDCILGYKVDNNRRSIPESFHWVKRTH